MAHPDLNALKDALQPLAKQMLNEHGEFYPYGAVMRLNGEIVHCDVADANDHPPATSLIKKYTEEFQRLAASGQIRAAGLCCDVRVSVKGHIDKIAAVQFALEHRNGESLNVYLPYDLDHSDKKRFGKIFASLRTKEFF